MEALLAQARMVYDQIFFWGGGGSSEGCLKWGGGGVIKGSLQKQSKYRGLVKAKVVRRGGGGLKVSPPLSPPENFNCTHVEYLNFDSG